MIETPIPTPTGWTKFGDLIVGDTIFGADGNPSRIIAQTPIFHGPDCYEVEFDDGVCARVSSTHLWTVERRSRRRVPEAYKTSYGKRVYREKARYQPVRFPCTTIGMTTGWRSRSTVRYCCPMRSCQYAHMCSARGWVMAIQPRRL